MFVGETGEKALLPYRALAFRDASSLETLARLCGRNFTILLMLRKSTVMGQPHICASSMIKDKYIAVLSLVNPA